MHVVLQQRQQVAHRMHMRHQVGLHGPEQLLAVAVDHPAATVPPMAAITAANGRRPDAFGQGACRAVIAE